MTQRLPLSSPICRGCHFAEPAHVLDKCLWGPGRYEPARCKWCGRRFHFLTEAAMPRDKDTPLPTEHQNCDEVYEELR